MSTPATHAPGRPAAPDRPGLLIARLGGVPVYIARGFAVLIVIITLLFGPGFGAGVTGYLLAFGFALLVFVSVLAHEASHALTGRLLGQRAREIVVNLWGGHTTFERSATSPWRTVLVSVAGPVSNGLLAVAAFAALAAGPTSLNAQILLFAFGVTNVLLSVFNLLPGLPLDGGRVLEAIVWQVTGHRWKGTRAAGWAGRVIAVATLGWVFWPLLEGRRPSLTSAMWGIIIAVMLWQAAGQAIQHARVRARATEIDLRAAMTPAIGLPQGTSLDRMGAALQVRKGPVAVVVTQAGRPVGIIDPDALAAVPPGLGADTAVDSVSVRTDPGDVLQADLTGETLFEALVDLRGPTIVIQDGPAVIGVLPTQVLMSLLLRDDRRR